jgi:hypothetical protein
MRWTPAEEIEIFDKKNFKYINGGKINVLQPIALTISKDKVYVGKICTKPNEKVIGILSLKGFNTVSKKLDCVLKGPMSIKDIYKNSGILETLNGDVYFVYYLYNKLLKFNSEGEKTYEIPLPPINEPEIILKGGGALLKEGLNYDLKGNSGRIWLLSRNKNISYLFELRDEKLVLKYKINNKLISFDFLGEKMLLAINEDFNIIKYRL